MKKILLVLTGGTIGSLADESGHNEARAGEAVSLLQEGFAKSGSPAADAEFETAMPLNLLSENMTPARWGQLAGYLKTVRWEEYEGMILAHGTDTLSFTANFLSLVLAGAEIPVFLVSSDYNLRDERANGGENFRAAVELLTRGIAPDLYVPYRNADGQMYLHRGAHLCQSGDYTADFFSADRIRLLAPGEGEGRGPAEPCYRLPAQKGAWPRPWPGRGEGPKLLNQLESMEKTVLWVRPYVGLDYDSLNLEGVKAVVHGLYHSSTACAEAAREGEEYTSYSVLHLLDRCREKGIPLYLQPCDPDAYGYSSTGLLLKAGAKALYGMIPEMAYVKTWLAVNLGLGGRLQEEFLTSQLNGEQIR